MILTTITRRAALGGCVSLALATELRGQSDEYLYGTTLYTGVADLVVINRETGEIETSREFAVPPVSAGVVGLTASKGQLLTWGAAASANVFLMELHPAGAQAAVVGDTGLRWTWCQLESDERTGDLWALGRIQFEPNLRLYSVDRLSGVPTEIGMVIGSGGVSTFAIDPTTGAAYAMGGNRLSTLDLTTPEATQIGTLQFGGSVLSSDMCFDGDGALWVSVLGSPPQITGVYKVDIGTMSVSKLIDLDMQFGGLAAAPGCFGEVYCTSTTNSLGCLPRIEARGQANPSTDRGFELSAARIRNNRFGALIYSSQGPAAIPFGGGTLCLQPSFELATPMDSGGSAHPAVDCSGSWAMDFNTFLSEQRGPKPLPGSMLYLQWLGRDAGGKATLTDAIRIEVCQ